MPFDRFTIEQLAGDLLPNPSLSQRIATGFNRNHPVNTEAGEELDEYRSAYGGPCAPAFAQAPGLRQPLQAWLANQKGPSQYEDWFVPFRKALFGAKSTKCARVPNGGADALLYDLMLALEPLDAGMETFAVEKAGALPANGADNLLNLAAAFRARNWGAQLVVVPAAAHLVPMEQPDAFAAAVGAFWRGVPTGPWFRASPARRWPHDRTVGGRNPDRRLTGSTTRASATSRSRGS